MVWEHVILPRSNLTFHQNSNFYFTCITDDFNFHIHVCNFPEPFEHTTLNKHEKNIARFYVLYHVPYFGKDVFILKQKTLKVPLFLE